MTGHAPDKVLRVPSVPDMVTHEDEDGTNGVLRESLGWPVAFQPVRVIACQVILEDCIVCTSAEIAETWIQNEVLYQDETRTNRHIDLMRRMRP
jgi:hypothetical protein